MLRAHAAFPFEFVLMLGDNMYGRRQPQDFVDKFESPYGPLLRMGVPFYAALGNHDEPTNRDLPAVQHGRRALLHVRAGDVRFFVFDTNLMDPKQLAGSTTRCSESTEEWKIATSIIRSIPTAIATARTSSCG